MADGARRSRAPAAWLAAAVLLAAPLGAQELTVVFLVRHAEKAAEPRADPPLTLAGEARARDLAAALGDALVSGVVVSPTLRARATAAPLARSRGLVPDDVPLAGGVAVHVRAVAEHVRRRYAGRTVLVVGHSNTIPAIIGALGGPRLEDLCDHEHSWLFTLVIRAGGEVALARAHYGEPDGAPASACGARPGDGGE